MTNFVDKVEALKMKAEKAIEPATPTDATESFYAFRRAASPEFILELCDKALEAERLREELGILQRTVQFNEAAYLKDHDGYWMDCKRTRDDFHAYIVELQAEIARLKGDR